MNKIFLGDNISIDLQELSTIPSRVAKLEQSNKSFDIVETFADLPSPSSVPIDKIYIVKKTTGVIGNRKLAGIYINTGSEWKRLAKNQLKAYDSDLLDGKDSIYYLDRTNHFGTQKAETIEDFQDAVSSNKDVTANTNARHTHNNKEVLDKITDEGNGNKFLADDGSYKPIVESFINLTDTPSKYKENGGKLLSVKTTEDGIEFTDAPDLSIYEEKINKVTNFSNEPSDERYPSEKLVKHSLDEKADKVHTHTSSDISDFQDAVSANEDVANNTLNRHNHINKSLLDSLTNLGDGSKFLADNGLYKKVHFTNLEDTPNSYDNNAGKLLVVKKDETGIEFLEQPDLSIYEKKENKVTNFSNEPSDEKYPSEKLVKNSLDKKADIKHSHTSKDITDFQEAVSQNPDVVANTKMRHTHSNKQLLDKLTDNGDGSKFLTDDGSYKNATFTILADTPNSYVNNAHKLLAVKGDETGIEFIGQPDLSIYEKKLNKVTEFSNEPSDEKYPSEKLVKNSLDKKADGDNNGNALNALRLNNKTLDDIKEIIKKFVSPAYDTGWQEFTWKNTGGGNKGAVFKTTVDFEIAYVMAFLRYKDTGHIFLISSVSANMTPRFDNKDYGAIVVIRDRTIGVGIGEDGIPLGESPIIFSNTEGLDTFGEKAEGNSNNVYDADDFQVRVLVFKKY